MGASRVSRKPCVVLLLKDVSLQDLHAEEGEMRLFIQTSGTDGESSVAAIIVRASHIGSANAAKSTH
jgi:hypothetical protein